MTLTQNHIIQARYSIMALLGQGGFGAVYKAWDVNLSKHVAIKENLDTSPEAQRQFTHEAQILSGLSHPNLPRVQDHFLLPGQGQYLVMDFIEGEDLQAMLDRLGQPLAGDYALPWIAQVCDALAYLHTQDAPIIHRDIKPANIKITPQGRAVLVDFGISKVYDPQLKTTVGARAVTPGYSPLEQYGQGTTDQRSDLYALGATLYVLLTGQEPQESVQRVINDQVRTAHQINSQVPPAVGEAIQRAMSVNPTGRYLSAEAFKADLLSAFQHARNEQLSAWYVQAQAAARRDEFTAAEQHLQQMLKFEPAHAEARALLANLAQRRDAAGRYAALAAAVASAQAEAKVLRQIDPPLTDPQGVLHLLTTDPPNSGQLASQVDNRAFDPRLNVLLLIAGIGVMLVGWIVSDAARHTVLATIDSITLGSGNFFLGLGVALQTSAVLWLLRTSGRSLSVRLALSGLVIAATVTIILGLAAANLAAARVELSQSSYDLGLGNFLLGFGVSLSLLRLVWLIGPKSVRH